MTAPTKRRDASGKFAKKNPDCEPATKGYVKCVARNMLDIKHSHEISTKDNLNISLGALTMLSSVASAASYIIASVNNIHDIATLMAPIFWMSMIIFAACLLATEHTDTKISSVSNCVPDYLKKYEPPCEPKRGCDEQEG